MSTIINKRRNAGLGAYPEISIIEAGQLGINFRAELAKKLIILKKVKKKNYCNAQFFLNEFKYYIKNCYKDRKLIYMYRKVI